MKSFHQFVIESPVETEVVVPVAVYLHNPAFTNLDVNHILQRVYAGELHTHELNLKITELIPTQLTVSQLKIMSMVNFTRINDHLKYPVVMAVPFDEDHFYLLDGHHRTCAMVMDGATSIQVRCINN